MNSNTLSALCSSFLLSIALLASGQVLAQSAFYTPTAAELRGAPGTLIRTEPMSGAPLGAAAYRILYRSTGVNGELIAVSGVAVVPVGTAPAEGRPVVAWAHPTTGVVPRCAPSLAEFAFQQMQGLRQFVEQGYVVVATDYPGLGTPAPHPYLVGNSEGRAVLDAVRATRALTDATAGNRFTVWGHSQGGHAALYAGLLVRVYAPELQLLGVATAAPATDLGKLLRDDFATAGGRNVTAMTLWSWTRVFGVPMAPVALPATVPLIDQLADQCLESIYDFVMRWREAEPLEQSFLTVKDITAVEPWRSLVLQNVPGPLAASIPVFIAQGSADTLVMPQVTLDYAKRLCANSSAVRLLMLPGVGHGLAAYHATDAAVSWLIDRFEGRPVPNDCGTTVLTGTPSIR